MTKAVILAAGKSTRTYPLTLTKPKPLLKVANKTLLEHNLDQLTGIVDEVFIVVGYKKEMIKKYFKNKYKKLKLTYIDQKEQLGTGQALLMAEKYLRCQKLKISEHDQKSKRFLTNSDFLVLMGDDLYAKKDIKKLLRNKYSVLTKEVKDPSKFGVFIVHNKKVRNIIEKPQLFVSKYANCGLYHLDKKIFDILEKLKKTTRNEYELTDGIKKFAQQDDVFVIEASFWQPIGYPWDLLTADRLLRKGNNIGKNTKISGKSINSSIGYNSIINGTVKDSIIMDNVTIEKDSIIENSIICDNVKFSGTIKSANTISIVKKIPINVENFGAIIADNVIAENVEIKAGSKIWPFVKIKGKITGDVYE